MKQFLISTALEETWRDDEPVLFTGRLAPSRPPGACCRPWCAGWTSIYPSAAAGVREGLDDTLTVIDLRLSERLQRLLVTTNPVESLLAQGHPEVVPELSQAPDVTVAAWHAPGCRTTTWTNSPSASIAGRDGIGASSFSA